MALMITDERRFVPFASPFRSFSVNGDVAPAGSAITSWNLFGAPVVRV